MKTSFISFLALASSLTGVFSSPTPALDNLAALEIEERAPATPLSIVTDLYNNVKTYTAQMNSTTSTLHPTSSMGTKAAAQASIQRDVNSIASAVTASTAQLHALPALKMMVKRNDPTAAALASVVQLLILEISGALNAVVAALGLSAALAIAAPLTAVLSTLLLVLDVLVGGLLTLVKGLLGGLLLGLSAALAGLIIL